MRPVSLILTWLGAGLLAGPPCATHAGEISDAVLPDGLYVEFTTPRGTITARLFPDLVPLTVAYFVGLTEGTIPFANRPAEKPFYDGLTFHRVVPGFVIQGGDPFANNKGDAGFKFADEFTPELKHDTAGVLSMANGAPNDNSCQFFLTLAPVNRLNYKHTVFGRVVRGLELLPQIRQGDAMTRVAIIRVGEKAAGYRADPALLASALAALHPIPPRDASLPPLFANESEIKLRPGYDAWITEKLHHYAVVSGVTIRVRLIPAFHAAPPDAATPNPLAQLHRQFAGDDPRAATLLFLVDERRWRVWLGDGLLERFHLAPGAVGDEPGATQLRNLRQVLLADARAAWDRGDLPHQSVDAAVTSLIEALDRPESLPAKAPDAKSSD